MDQFYCYSDAGCCIPLTLSFEYHSKYIFSGDQYEVISIKTSWISVFIGQRDVNLTDVDYGQAGFEEGKDTVTLCNSIQEDHNKKKLVIIYTA